MNFMAIRQSKVVKQPRYMSVMLTNKKQILTRFASLCLFLFYSFNALVALCLLVPWFMEWGIIEDPILFMPRWLVFILLVPAILFKFKLLVEHRYILLPTLIFTMFFYLGFQLPNFMIQNESASNYLRVMSVNLGGITDNRHKITAQIKYGKASIIAFQETSKDEVIEITPESWNVLCNNHQCVASKYQLEVINSQNRRVFDGWGTIYTLYKVIIGEQGIYVINVHLETPRKGFEDVSLLNLDFNSMATFFELRFLETQLVRSRIIGKAPLIIMGDFNMPVESSIYRDIFSQYTNTFNDAGFGFGHTKFTRLHGIRIDHILIDNNFKTLAAWVAGDVGSDHRPIYADISFKND